MASNRFHQAAEFHLPSCCCSVSKLSLTLCDSVDTDSQGRYWWTGRPGFPVHHCLLELTQTHVHWVSDAIQPSVVPFSSCPQSFPASGSFQMSQLFSSGGQSIGALASASCSDWFRTGRAVGIQTKLEMDILGNSGCLVMDEDRSSGWWTCSYTFHFRRRQDQNTAIQSVLFNFLIIERNVNTWENWLCSFK